MIRVPTVAIAFVGALAFSPALAAGLTDTGQGLCDSGSNVLVACSAANTGDGATYPRQDARFGRDAKAAAGTLTKIGAGAAGFDYTKVGNNGSDLPATATLGVNAGDWACTRDNVTGLVWEVKGTDGGPRDLNWTFTWYNSDAATNGGNPGLSASGNCAIAGRCDTEFYAHDVNIDSLCSFQDWRLPTPRELDTLVHLGQQNPSIDTTYFPNTLAAYFWSAATFVQNPGTAWIVGFDGGYPSAGNKMSAGYPVRLVRGGPF